MKRALAIVALVALSLFVAQPARAVSTSGAARNVPYVIGFYPPNSLKQPYLGQMVLNFHNGVINGRYTDISIVPGSPFAGRTNVPVQGGSDGEHVMLNIGGVSFHGSVHEGWMSGSATIRGRVYVFEAEQGRPGRE